MINISIPDYYGNIEIIMCFLELQKTAPDMFFENRKLDSAYGMPPGLIWNGGRLSVGTSNSQKKYYIYDTYKTFHPDFKIRHTCTNMFLTNEMFLDTACNSWIKYTEDEKNSIIVNNEELKAYLEKTYPKYNYVISVTKNLNNLELYNKYSKSYLTVVNYNYNVNDNFLSKLKHPENIELICAEPCIPNCPGRKAHWERISKAQLGYPGCGDTSCTQIEKSDFLNFYTNILNREHSITNERMNELYEKYGICNFKLSGRGYSPYLFIELLLYYLIKPEYRDSLRQNLLQMAYHTEEYR